MKTRALFSLLLASLLLFAGLPALALDAEPAPDSVVSPGDTIAYTYVLPADMTNCVLRFSLSSGVSLQPDSVQVKASGPYEVIYGSDGCVIMADALDKGDTLVFVAQVGEEAVEVWAKLVAADGSINGAAIFNRLRPDMQFCGNHNLIAKASDRTPDNLLVMSGIIKLLPVSFCRIEKIASIAERFPNGFFGISCARYLAVSVGESHTAHAYFTDA